MTAQRVWNNWEVCNTPEWQTIETAPKDRFVFLYCPEDESRWFAKWQGGQWFGVDDQGLTRQGWGIGGVTGWIITHWMPLPEPPASR